MVKKKLKLRGPKYISEMISYKCPFTNETKLMHPTKWPTYVRDRVKGKTLEEILIVYGEVPDSNTKELLEKAMLNYHNSVEQ